MKQEEEKIFIKFLLEKKKRISQENLDNCIEVQKTLKGLGINKSIDQVIVEKGYVGQEDMSNYIKDFHGGDEEFIRGYRITQKLGEGAMGEVYKALDLSNNKPVAIKVLYPYLAKKKATAQRFLREAQICIKKLSHKNIVKGYDVGVELEKDHYFYVMELVEGKNLKKILQDKGIFSEKDAIEIMYQIASALEHAGQFRLVHRDIKPDNIILNQEGEAKLCDLGLARDWGQDLSLTRTGAVMGTPFYMSPEAASGVEKLDCRSDIYSLGATIYHMIVGKVPFEGANSAIVLTKHQNTPVIPPIEINPNISETFSEIITKTMEKSPKNRYQTPTELIEDLNKLTKVEKFEKLETLERKDSPIKYKKTAIIDMQAEKEKEKEKSAEKTKMCDTTEISLSGKIVNKKTEPDTTEISIPSNKNISPVDTEEICLPEITIKKSNIVNIEPKKGYRQDPVEEYILSDDSKMDVEARKKQKMFSPFFTSTEQRVMSKSKSAQLKLIAIGVTLGVVVVAACVGLCFLIVKILGFMEG